MTEQEAIDELMNMSQDELDLVQFDVVHLICQVKGCKHYTRARDYGIAPVYYHAKMRDANNKPHKWHDVSTRFWCCSAHWKFIKRLEKKFDKWHIAKKLFDYQKTVIIKPKK